MDDIFNSDIKLSTKEKRKLFDDCKYLNYDIAILIIIDYLKTKTGDFSDSDFNIDDDSYYEKYAEHVYENFGY